MCMCAKLHFKAMHRRFLEENSSHFHLLPKESQFRKTFTMYYEGATDVEVLVRILGVGLKKAIRSTMLHTTAHRVAADMKTGHGEFNNNRTHLEYCVLAILG